MGQTEFHNTFQLVPRRDTLKLVTEKLHLKKEVRLHIQTAFLRLPNCDTLYM
jgi:hypothetical protein